MSHRAPQKSSTSRPPRDADPGEQAPDKLQKVLAEQGYGSRRQMEQWISDGRITVNGETAHLGQRVSGADAVSVDGRPISIRPDEGCRVLVLNKAAGIICTRQDPEGRRTIYDDLPSLRGGRWISVGRLDVQTSGLLLLTNDGALAHRMMHPSTGLDREYAVRVNGRLEDEQVAALIKGVTVDGETLSFSDIRYFNGSGLNHWYHVVLMEGRNREVRRLFESIGFTVSRLKRVRYGPVVLPSTLRHGERREMGGRELKVLYRMLQLPLTLPRKRRHHAGQRKESELQPLLLPYPKLQLP